MTRRYPYLIVGCGFTGATLAERLAAHGHEVLIVERRPHIGGNAYDCLDEHGLRISPYGPHAFHTRSEKVWNYVNRFAQFNGYELRIQARYGERFYALPLNLSTFNAFYGLKLRSEDVAAFLDTQREPIENPRNAEEAIVSRVGWELYNAFYAGYTRKQWGVEPRKLDASVTLRLPIRYDADTRYFSDPWQGLPVGGYTALFERMLADPKITVLLNTDYREMRESLSWERLIYTGPIDAYFDHVLGRLPYRSIDFQFESLRSPRCVQPVGVLNYPNEHAYTRSTEYRHLYRQQSDWTSLGRDYPCWNDDAPYYPVPSPDNRALYARYKALADAEPRTVFCGRLGTYQYYNMDQCIAQALNIADGLLGSATALAR